ncbi:MAG: hypothetical protein HYY93_12315 [Planctomycetes bacterium]|nr:hypothetical protein [Planctomycetota bacterium]
MSGARAHSLESALKAMDTMAPGEPYALRREDSKRRLLEDLRRLCDDLKIEPLVIGALAVNHHGYSRFTADVDLLLARKDAEILIRRLRSEPGWKRYHEGFKNTILDVGVDLLVEGERTSPQWEERFPAPTKLRVEPIDPFSVPRLADLLALRVMSGRARDDADVVELLKRHVRRASRLRVEAARRLATVAARDHLEALCRRATEEMRRWR